MKRFSTLLAIVFLFACVFTFGGCKKDVKANLSYEISVSLDKNVLSGKETVSFTNTTDNAFSVLKFNLFGNAFRKDAKFRPIAVQYENRAYYNGFSYGEMNVSKVCDKDGTLNFNVGGQDQNILQVELRKELYPDETAQVEIEFSLTLANVIARTGINENTINLGNFYPILCGIDGGGFYECVYYSNGDPFFSDVADYVVEIEVDSDYVVASGGVKKGENNKGNRKTITYKQSSARSFCMILSKQFKVLEQTACGTTINYYYYGDQTPENSIKVAVDSIELFTNLFGEYPYQTFSVVETAFMQGGMEYPGIVMISDNLEPSAYREVIVHETAHQWWQSAVGNNEIEYGFLDEGLCEYSVVLFYENHPEYDMSREKLIKSSELTYKTFCSVSDKLFGGVNTVMLRPLGEFKSEYEYVNMAYVKPCIMYDYLRTTVGEQTFFKGLKRYYKDYQMKNATPSDLVGAFEKVGADSNGFFESFFNGKVVI